MLRYQDSIQSLKQWRKEKIDLSFHLRSGVRNEILAFTSRIPIRIGFHLKGSFQFLTHKIKKNRFQHCVNNGKMLLSLLQKDISYYLPELYPDPNSIERCNVFFKQNGVTSKKYIVIHPTGITMIKENWNLDFYSKLVKNLNCSFKCPIIMIGTLLGKNKVKEYFSNQENVIFAMGHNINLTSEIIKQSILFIGNDSGPMHIAAALNKPQIAIFGATDPVLGFAPMNSKAVIINQTLKCKPCSLHGSNSCPKEHFKCMLSHDNQQIYSNIQKLLH